METHAAGFTPPLPPDFGDNQIKFNLKLPPAVKKTTLAPSSPTQHSVKEEAPSQTLARNGIELPKLKLPSFAAPSSRVAQQSAQVPAAGQSRLRRDMPFDPNNPTGAAPVATPRVEDAQKLVPGLQNMKLVPINRQNFLQRQGLVGRQQRQSFMKEQSNLSPLPSTASTGSLSSLSTEG